jgi:hypothetical protein
MEKVAATQTTPKKQKESKRTRGTPQTVRTAKKQRAHFFRKPAHFIWLVVNSCRDFLKGLEMTNSL